MAARARLTLDDRFWPNVDRREPDACWPWVGPRDRHDEPLFREGHHPRVVHWVAHELTGGPPWHPQASLCPVCPTKGCCNPAHSVRFDTLPALPTIRLRDARSLALAEVETSNLAPWRAGQSSRFIAFEELDAPWTPPLAAIVDHPTAGALTGWVVETGGRLALVRWSGPSFWLDDMPVLARVVAFVTILVVG